MGLFKKKIRNGLRGSARIVSATQAPDSATYGNLSMTLVVEVEGVPAYSHRYSKMVVPVAKWPSPGEVVPVVVDPTDLRRVEVPWDEMMTNRDSAMRSAEQMAALLRQQQQGAPPGADPGTGPAPGDVVGQLQQMFPGAVVQVDGNGDGGGGMPVPGPKVVASQSNADPVARLEKLARLRDAGIVDQAQFEQLRAQILEQAGLDD